MSQVPAATRTLRVLRYLASQAAPVPLESIMRACELPRSTAYHLINAMIEEGFVLHVADDHRYGLGVAAYEVGSGYTRHCPPSVAAPRTGRWRCWSISAASTPILPCCTDVMCSTSWRNALPVGRRW